MMEFKNGYGLVDNAFEDKGWLCQVSEGLDRKETVPAFGDLVQEMTDPLFSKIVSAVAGVPSLASSRETANVIVLSPGQSIPARSIQVNSKTGAFQRITMVLFLNEHYNASQGGAFEIEGPYGHFEIEPLWNRALLYESDDRIFSGIGVWAPEDKSIWKAVSVNYFSSTPPSGRDVTTKAVFMSGGGSYRVV